MGRDSDDTERNTRSVSMKDVAAAAGVSLGTVSNVLNRPQVVAPATRSRVERAVLDLGFIRNESARQLRAGRSRTLAYIILDASNPFFIDVAKGVEEVAEEHNLSLFICNSDNRSDRERTYLARLREQRVQGILVTPVDPSDQVLHERADPGTPIVIVDRVSPQHHCSVAVDDVHGGRIAIEHLLDLGHERLAFVGGPDSLGQVGDRRAGALQALTAAGLPIENLTILATDAMTVAEGRRAGQRLAGIPSARRPQAAFCANDLLALGLLQQCVSLGIGVPKDLAIVGYDDIGFAEAAAVPLTSVRQPRIQLGRTATELLLAESGDPAHEHQQIVFTPDLIARRSTIGAD